VRVVPGAGDRIVVRGGNRGDDVSVLTGEIVWRDENARHGGLFRSDDRTGAGRAELRVLAGSIEIV
jgi:hypothetical protein